MIHDLKPYPTYKNSGVPWLGDVPEHWALHSLGALTSPVSQRGRPDLPLLSVVRDKGVVPRSSMSDDENHNFIPDDLTNYKVVHQGNLVINKMKAWQGSIGIAPMDGIVSPAYFVFAFRIGDRHFGQALLRSKTYVPFFAQASDGVRIGQWDLSTHGMKRIPVVVPPLEEQSAIVRFLDYVDRRIRGYTRAKQKLIALLNEQKQAIIHHAVTRGLDPYVRLKPSGVEWLGDVPEHWETARLKDAASVQTGLTLGKSYQGAATESRPYLRVANVQNGHLDLREVKYLDVPPHEAAGAILRAGDVLMTEGGDIDKLGRGCVWRDEIPGCLHQNHVFAVRCRPDILLPEFLVGLMVSLHGRAYFQMTAKQTTNLASTNSTTLRAFPVLLPPVSEQARILSGLGRLTSGIDATMAGLEREISLLREYRTRLIADVVTGKLDVREVAARLQDEPEESEPIDDTEAVAEDGEAAEGTDLDVAAEEVEA
jgi:type I restriction enzyme S subunit